MNISRRAMKIIELAQKIANKRGVTVQDASNDEMKEYKEKYEYVA